SRGEPAAGPVRRTRPGGATRMMGLHAAYDRADCRMIEPHAACHAAYEKADCRMCRVRLAQDGRTIVKREEQGR
ncbi:hypothetical protein, partial [Paenibacillus thiaminolyticus]|uniref:hypothetical protein n=1 Tax=Paenibacillus thiaminolyticus TaxID=49283 RepID=UPI002DB7C4B4